MSSQGFKNMREVPALSFIFLVSAVALAFLFWLIYFSDTGEFVSADFGFLRYVNGFLNFVSVIFLSAGFYYIRKKSIANHKKMMVGAFCTSSLFLVSYIVYHFTANSTPFLAEETAIRVIYFFILISHIVLSALILPFIFITFFYSLTDRISKHKRLARWVFPVWYYNSVTGVIIVLMLDYFNS